MKNHIKALIAAVIGFNIFSAFHNSPAQLLGVGLLGWAAWLFIKAIKGSATSAASDSLKDQIAGFNYTHFHDKSGIAVDPAKRELHLISNGEYKIYPFEKIRSWETNISSGGLIMAPGLIALAENRRREKANKDETGLFLAVKDVDHPKWHIEFPPKDVKRQLERWMEILRQELNEA